MPLDPPRRSTPNRAHHRPRRSFTFFRAECAEDRLASYRLRYQVYCIERGFLDKASYSQRLERDAYDTHALHFLACHANGIHAGTVRLVLHSPLGFPLTRHCKLDSEYAFIKDTRALPRYAEISRLAVSRDFRRRDADTLYGSPPRHFTNGREAVPRSSPEIVSGLYRLLYQDSKRLGITHWVVAMERSLHITLRRMGFAFTPIGPEVDYFGPVRPYLARIDALEHHLHRISPSAYGYMASGLEPEHLPAFIRDQEALKASES